MSFRRYLEKTKSWNFDSLWKNLNISCRTCLLGSFLAQKKALDVLFRTSIYTMGCTRTEHGKKKKWKWEATFHKKTFKKTIVRFHFFYFLYSTIVRKRFFEDKHETRGLLNIQFLRSLTTTTYYTIHCYPLQTLFSSITFLLWGVWRWSKHGSSSFLT